MEISGVGQNNVQNYFYNKSEVSVETAANSGDAIQVKGLDEKKADTESLDKAIKKLNKFLEDDSTHAEYSVHEDFNTIMIKIVDDKTKEVIMEIPPQKILDMVASICKQFGLLDKKA